MTTWKIDPALRERLKGSEPIAIAVQPLATATDADLLALGEQSLTAPATAGGLWTGDVPADRIATIAALSFVGYVHDGTAPASTGIATTRRTYAPPTTAKRGHTRLPPRRP
jgi:hypothetical protein